MRQPSGPKRRELALAGVAGACALFFLTYYGMGVWGGVKVDTLRPAYRHHELVEIRVRTRDRALRRCWETRPPRAMVSRQGTPIPTIGRLHSVALSWDPKRGGWIGKWPCPWNAPDGAYKVDLLPDASESRPQVRSGAFRIARRKLPRLPEGFAVLTWESIRPLSELRVRAPDGEMKGWQGLLDWVQYVEADALWMLAGQTPGLEPGQKWVARNLDMIPEVARECKRRNIRFGVYAMCYLTMSNVNRVPGYEYALEISSGEVKTTRAISIRDPRRPKDVAEFLKRFRDLPGVDFLGLDYIRDPLGGYELVDDFYAEMPDVQAPPGWDKMGRRERLLHFARKKIPRKDKALIDAWQWWRAHRVSRVIESIRRELGGSKPLWAFTLTWERGWHHGQDVVMFHDAGVDVDALMLYEADAEQFEWMVNDWRSYLRKGEVQLLVGDVVDWPLHQRSPLGPRELGNRLRRAIDGIHPDGRPAGLFVHDLERALRGRLGPYSTRDWLDEVRRVIREFKAAPAWKAS